MTRVTRVTVDRSCAICERTLLMGERAVRFSPNGGNDYVDVCPLCTETAVRVTAGSARVRRRRRRSRRPAPPAAAAEAGSRPSSGRASGRRSTVASEPILRRLSEQELAMVEAADLFNASQYRRTVGGIAKSLGDPRSRSIVALRRQRGGGRHGRLGHLLVPVPRLAGLRQSGAARGARPRPGGARGVVHRMERPLVEDGPHRPGHRPVVASLRSLPIRS